MCTWVVLQQTTMQAAHGIRQRYSSCAANMECSLASACLICSRRIHLAARLFGGRRAVVSVCDNAKSSYYDSPVGVALGTCVGGVTSYWSVMSCDSERSAQAATATHTTEAHMRQHAKHDCLLQLSSLDLPLVAGSLHHLPGGEQDSSAQSTIAPSKPDWSPG